jgi:tetratricopeptide (TPR) repeat protein
MEDRHLALATLARLATGRIETEEVQQVVIPHLVAVCSGCRQIFEELQRLKEEVGHWDEMVAVLEGREAPGQWKRLQDLPYEEQLRQVEEDGELQTWALCRLLLRKSLQATYHRPDLAVQLARLSVKIAAHLGETYDRDWVADLSALSFAHLGNACRVLGEHHGAEAAFHDAHERRRAGTGNPRVEAEILDLEASLRIDRQQFAKALDLLDRAFATYAGANHAPADLQSAAKVLILKANALQCQGELEAAIRTLQQGRPMIDDGTHPRLLLCLKHNLVSLLAEAGLHEEASALLPEVQQLAVRLGNTLDLIRLRWVEGRIAFGRGQLGPAEQAFREVQQDFLERDLGYDAALASLHLAVLYAQEGCIPELKQLALDILPAFSSREVHREAMAALLLFQHACEEERLTAELARQLAALLVRERRTPSLAPLP